MRHLWGIVSIKLHWLFFALLIRKSNFHPVLFTWLNLWYLSCENTLLSEHCIGQFILYPYKFTYAMFKLLWEVYRPSILSDINLDYARFICRKSEMDFWDCVVLNLIVGYWFEIETRRVGVCDQLNFILWDQVG